MELKEVEDRLKEEQKKRITSLKAKANMRRTFVTKMADAMTTYFGSTASLILHTTIFLMWIVMNSGMLLGFIPFDPYPFVFLTSAVSIEAIFLAIFVLISQNRQTEIADLREEVALQIAVKSEEEITKILKLLDGIRHHIGIKTDDTELHRMEKPLNPDKIVEQLEEEIAKES